MVWELTATQCLFIALIGFAVFGFIRGWRREIISLAFILASIVILVFWSIPLTQLILVKIPRAVTLLTDGTAGKAEATITSNSDMRVTIVAAVTFVIVSVAGYLLSYRLAAKATTPADHILGLIPGLLAGFLIVNFVTSSINKSSLFSFAIASPSQPQVSSSLLIIFLIVVGALIVGLIAANAKKKAAPKK
jgi:uncharacterized membrane protein required for colicin V production